MGKFLDSGSGEFPRLKIQDSQTAVRVLDVRRGRITITGKILVVVLGLVEGSIRALPWSAVEGRLLLHQRKNRLG